MTPYSDYQELDAGPDATLQALFIKDLQSIQAKATYWDVYCAVEPSAPAVSYTHLRAHETN